MLNFSHRKFIMYAMEKLWVSIYFHMIFKLKVRQKLGNTRERVPFYNCFIRFFLQSYCVSLPCLWHSWGDQLVPEVKREIAQLSCLSNCGPIISQGTQCPHVQNKTLSRAQNSFQLSYVFQSFHKKTCWPAAWQLFETFFYKLNVHILLNIFYWFERFKLF